MSNLMRCLYCGLLQDEPAGVKSCQRCGGELSFKVGWQPGNQPSYLMAQLELDQVAGPAGKNFDRHLLLTIRAPQQVPADQAAPTQTGQLPLSFMAVLDISGSMSGEKLAQAKEAVKRALVYLQDGDIFGLVTFESNVHCVIEPAPLNGQARQVIKNALDEIQATGMTALYGGLDMGVEKAAGAKRDSTLVLLLSDGQANVGETDLERLGQRGFEARNKGITVSTIGVGLDYNEALMSEIATQGGGRFYHLTAASQIPAYLNGELGEVSMLAGRNVQLHLAIPNGAVLVPFSAAYPAQQDGSQATVNIGDIPCETELEIPFRISLPAQPAGARASVEGELTYLSPLGNSLKTILNRVTIRCVEQGVFELRTGVVMPVAETVFKHMKAAYVMNVSRSRSKGSLDSDSLVKEGITGLQAYAAVLGDELASQQARQMRDQMEAPPSPAVAKQMLYESHRIQRSSKKYDR